MTSRWNDHRLPGPPDRCRFFPLGSRCQGSAASEAEERDRRERPWRGLHGCRMPGAVTRHAARHVTFHGHEKSKAGCGGQRRFAQVTGDSRDGRLSESARGRKAGPPRRACGFRQGAQRSPGRARLGCRAHWEPQARCSPCPPAAAPNGASPTSPLICSGQSSATLSCDLSSYVGTTVLC